MSQKIIVPLTGLHCRACELLVEDKLKEFKNIDRVRVDYKTSQAEIYYHGAPPTNEALDQSLKEVGYRLGNVNAKTAPEKLSGWDRFSQWFSLFAIIIILYWLFSRFNLLDLGGFLQKEFSWPLAVLIGLVAGLSTCLALVGGLVLGVSAEYAKNHPTASQKQKFIPQLFFNAGRIGGFFVLGGLLGVFGAAFRISTLTNSILTLAVGLILLLLGLRLLNIFPAINSFQLAWPKRFWRVKKINTPFLLGALTFFLPCGFTQAMQLYALSSGSFLSGGLIMALFALGTAPGLLGIGGLAGLLDRKKSQTFFKFVGAVVVVFALINLSNGYQLLQVSASGWPQDRPSENKLNTEKPVAQNDANVQIVKMTESSRGYMPDEFTIKKDIPVRWIIDAKAPYSCASALIIPSLKIQKQLRAGENIIEFTPQKTGDLPFSCSMGMYTGVFHVVN